MIRYAWPRFLRFHAWRIGALPDYLPTCADLYWLLIEAVETWRKKS